MFLSPGHDWVVMINLGFFLLKKFGVVCAYTALPGVVIWQYIHPSMLHSF